MGTFHAILRLDRQELETLGYDDGTEPTEEILGLLDIISLALDGEVVGEHSEVGMPEENGSTMDLQLEVRAESKQQADRKIGRLIAALRKVGLNASVPVLAMTEQELG